MTTIISTLRKRVLCRSIALLCFTSSAFAATKTLTFEDVATGGSYALIQNGYEGLQ
jgi:hypothetical protein